MSRAPDLMRGVVHPWHLDDFGHMNVRHYAPFFDDACYHMWAVMGLDASRLIATYGLHMVTAAAQTTFRQELRTGDLFRITGAPVKVGTRSCAFHLRMLHVASDHLHATYDVTEVFFDPETRRAADIPDAVRNQLNAQIQELS